MRKSRSTFRHASPRVRLLACMIAVRFTLALAKERHSVPLSSSERHHIHAAYLAQCPVTTVAGVLAVLRAAQVGCTHQECAALLRDRTVFTEGDILQWSSLERLAAAIKYKVVATRGSGLDEDAKVMFSVLDEDSTGEVHSGKITAMLQGFALEGSNRREANHQPPSSQDHSTASTWPEVSPDRTNRINSVAFAPELLNVDDFVRQYIDIAPDSDPSQPLMHPHVMGGDSDGAQLGGNNAAPRYTITGSSSSRERHTSSPPLIAPAQSTVFTSQKSIVIATSRLPQPPALDSLFSPLAWTTALEKRITQWGKEGPSWLRHSPATPVTSPITPTSKKRNEPLSEIHTPRGALPPVTKGFSSSAPTGRYAPLSQSLPQKPTVQTRPRLNHDLHEVTIPRSPRASSSRTVSSKQFELRRTDARLIGFCPTAY